MSCSSIETTIIILESEYRNQAECIIAKNRHGETGKVMLQWLPEFTTFSGLDWQHQE